MSDIIIQKYHDGYRDEIINLILKIQNEEFNIPVTIQDQPDLKIISSFYQKDRGNFWVALVDNKVIGTIGLIDIGNDHATLRKMFVAAEYRGKKYNVAKQLWSEMLKWCKNQGINAVFFGTVAILLAAQRFYEKNGCQEILKKDLPVNFPIMEVDTKFYKYSV